jgi:hypothetical protein
VYLGAIRVTGLFFDSPGLCKSKAIPAVTDFASFREDPSFAAAIVLDDLSPANSSKNE